MAEVGAAGGAGDFDAAHAVAGVFVGFDGVGLPLGMQIMGRPFDEATVLRVGQAYETASDNVGRLAAA